MFMLKTVAMKYTQNVHSQKYLLQTDNIIMASKTVEIEGQRQLFEESQNQNDEA